MKKQFFGALALVGLMAGAAQAQDLMITGYLDGTLTGGEPKVVELYAINNIADLSQYAISRAGNGSNAFDAIGANHILPAISLNAGDFYYAYGNSFTDQAASFASVFPAKVPISVRNFGVNSNGDDVTGLFNDATGAFAGGETLVDVLGVLGVDGTGQPWEHLDGWAYSNNGRTPSATFTLADWSFSGPNALDGADAAGIAASFPDMTFVIPEPASLALLGLGGLAMLRRRSA